MHTHIRIQTYTFIDPHMHSHIKPCHISKSHTYMHASILVFSYVISVHFLCTYLSECLNVYITISSVCLSFYLNFFLSTRLSFYLNLSLSVRLQVEMQLAVGTRYQTKTLTVSVFTCVESLERVSGFMNCMRNLLSDKDPHCVCVYVCMYVCMYAYTSGWLNCSTVCMYVCMYVYYVHTCTYEWLTKL